MKITIFTADEGGLEIKNFSRDTFDGLLEELNDPESFFIQLEMDGREVHVNKNHIVRIDVD